MPKFYKLAEIRDGALTSKGIAKTIMVGNRLEAAIQIIFESIKIHSYPEEREWREICNRISNELHKKLDGVWNCIASDHELYVCVQPVADDYINIELDDLFIKVFRSR